MRVLLLGLAFGAFMFARPAEAAQSARERAIHDFQTRIEEDVLADEVGSIAAGVIVGTDLVWAHGIGLTDRERELDADAESIYRIGSISKSVTAATMMARVPGAALEREDSALAVRGRSRPGSDSVLSGRPLNANGGGSMKSSSIGSRISSASRRAWRSSSDTRAPTRPSHQHCRGKDGVRSTSQRFDRSVKRARSTDR